MGSKKSTDTSSNGGGGVEAIAGLSRLKIDTSTSQHSPVSSLGTPSGTRQSPVATPAGTRPSPSSKNVLSNADIYHAKGFALRKDGKFREAVAEYTTAINLDKNQFKAYFNR